MPRHFALLCLAVPLSLLTPACSRPSASAELSARRDSLQTARRQDSVEAARNVAFCDSILPLLRSEMEALRGTFSFEKDTAYATSGNYVHRRQTIEHNIGRSYLRSGVTEQGEPFLASVYAGRRPIRHTALRISIPTGLYAQTPDVPFDGGRNYRFEDDGLFTEVVTYRGEQCLPLLQFLYENRNAGRLRADYLGGEAYYIHINAKDLSNIASTYQFSHLLHDIVRFETERQKSARRLDYLRQKLAPATSPDSADSPSPQSSLI
ncbi:MAG: hypothetical protein LBB27_00235 [Tannerellaceae bacterium]|jgi:hypothetical protein|nr:hypothetical protein [Tannerellaceae bacterium]